MFGDITMLLEQQFERLGAPEQEVIYWLAIEREAISAHELRAEDVEERGKQSIAGYAGIAATTLFDRASRR